MSQLKKVLITVPDALLSEVDSLADSENRNRSELVREAMKMYLNVRKTQHEEEQMKQGYLKMADINLRIAQMCFQAEEETASAMEEKLAECE